MKNALLVLLSLVLFLGCAAPKPVVDPNAKPSWTLNPPMDGKIYGVGSSPIHVKGLNHQRALAISMAIDEIARQNGVVVNNTLERITMVNGAQASTASRDYSVQSVNGQTVKAHIVEMWQDPYSSRIYVLMVQQ
ncbi:MAG: hypothetical protein KU37_08060 [Sulfuricurvum sp. PC08-66]|nr:MAG: hypothetical protein KU37_08060 [Sulfuricurvum sp. PC08-66]